MLVTNNDSTWVWYSLNVILTYSLLHLECYFFNLKSQSIIQFSRSLLPLQHSLSTHCNIVFRLETWDPLLRSLTHTFRWKGPRRLRLEIKGVQPIAFGVSFNLLPQSQSHWSLFSGTWQKRPRTRLLIEIWGWRNNIPNAVSCSTWVWDSVEYPSFRTSFHVCKWSPRHSKDITR